MTYRITEITPEQQARFPEWVEKWTKIGLATGEADWDLWEESAEKCYVFSKLEFPTTIVRTASPLASAYANGVLSWLHDQGKTVADMVPQGSQITVWRNGAKVGARILPGLVKDQKHSVAVLSNTPPKTDPTDIEIPISHVRATWSSFLGGQWWVAWNAHTSFLQEVMGLVLDGDLGDRDKAYANAQKSVGWWYPNRQFVVVTDRPRVLSMDVTQGVHELHCEDGPAIAWEDGQAQYYWRGVQVPKDMIEGEWTIEQIFGESNTEVRRCAIEKMGWDRFVEVAGLTLVDEAEDPSNAPHKLRLYDIPENVYGVPDRVVIMTNGSPDRDGKLRMYGETVPATISSAVEAAAWQYGVDVDVYRQLERRT